MDSIASCAFGVDPESFTNKDSNFVKNAARVFTTKPIDMLMILLALIPGFQTLNNYLKLSIFPAPETSFFVNIIKQTIENRKNTKERRNDMVDLMLERKIATTKKTKMRTTITKMNNLRRIPS